MAVEESWTKSRRTYPAGYSPTSPEAQLETLLARFDDFRYPGLDEMIRQLSGNRPEQAEHIQVALKISAVGQRLSIDPYLNYLPCLRWILRPWLRSRHFKVDRSILENSVLLWEEAHDFLREWEGRMPGEVTAFWMQGGIHWRGFAPHLGRPVIVEQGQWVLPAFYSVQYLLTNRGRLKDGSELQLDCPVDLIEDPRGKMFLAFRMEPNGILHLVKDWEQLAVDSHGIPTGFR